MNNGAEPATLDPSKISGVPEHRIYMALFEGLVVNDPTTSQGPARRSRELDHQPRRHDQITFKLRKANWSDGTTITAQTVVDSWIRTLDPATGAEYAYMVNMVVKGAEDFNSGKAGKEAVAIKAIDDSHLPGRAHRPDALRRRHDVPLRVRHPPDAHHQRQGRRLDQAREYRQQRPLQASRVEAPGIPDRRKE